jgi:cytochrome P450
VTSEGSARPPDAEADFVPPFPPRHTGTLPVLRLLGMARRNYLSIWSAHDFELPITTSRLLRRQVVVCNAPDLVKEAFQTNHPSLERKSPQQRNALAPLIGDGLFISDGPVWAQRRKIVTPIVHASRVSGFAPIMVDTILARRDAWRARGTGARIDVLSEMADLTAEVICRTIFGQELGQEYATEVVGAFTEYQRYIDQIDVFSLLDLPAWLPRFRGRTVQRSVRRIMSVLDEIIARHEESKRAGNVSVIGGLLEARDDAGRPLGHEAIRNEAAVIFMAGHETTANTLAWAWYLISQSPRVANRLRAEVDAVLTGGTPGFADVARLPYTRAIIEETLRLYPPVPILAREATAPLTLGGIAVEKGALVLVVPWLLQRRAELWPDPDNFRPERHLEVSGTGGKPYSKYSYVPFSIGPRICPGLAFGMTESILGLAILARDFALELAPGTDVQPVARLTLRPGATLPMVLRARSGQGGDD